MCIYWIKKTYINDTIYTVKSNLHYLFLKKSLIHICLVAPFFFKLNNNISILTTFAWSLMVMSWPYMNAHWLKQYASKQKTTRSTAEERTHVINCVLHYAKARIDSHQRPLTTLTDASDCQPPSPPSRCLVRYTLSRSHSTQVNRKQP
jgi:hypothetical protein